MVLRLLLAALVIAAAVVAARWAAPSPGCAAFREPGGEVWLAIGQSNAANHAAVGFIVGPGVSAFDGRRCVPARDPLPGASGARGSVWTPLAGRWIAEGRVAHVLLVARGEATTAIADWRPGGALFGRIVTAKAGLDRQGLTVTRVLWQQGESDAGLRTDPARYRRSLIDFVNGLRRIGIAAPVYIAPTSRCGPSSHPALRDAQAAATRLPGVWRGPDYDSIGPEMRFEKCHLDGRGQMRAAALWDAALAGGASGG